MRRLLTALAFLATSFVSYAGQPLEPAFSAGAAAELRPYSAAAERGWTRPGSDSRPATTTASESRSFTTFRMTSARMTLADGHNVLVDVCDEGIFRVRISPRKEFEESLMERYGCIKTDWAPVKATESNKGSEWTVTTTGYSLTVNKKTGVIALKESGE